MTDNMVEDSIIVVGVLNMGLEKWFFSYRLLPL